MCIRDSTNANVMMPMAFCASFAPWLNAMKLAETSCMRENSRKARARGTRKNTQLRITISTSPMANPKNGDNTIASSTERRPENLTAAVPPWVNAAPTSPPILSLIHI